MTEKTVAVTLTVGNTTIRRRIPSSDVLTELFYKPDAAMNDLLINHVLQQLGEAELAAT